MALPGRPRPPGSGRPKGGLNKRTLQVMEILQKHKFNPVEELIECYHRTANTDEVMHLGIKCLEILMPYCYSKVSSDGALTAADIAIVDQIKELANRPHQEIIEIAQKEIKKLNE